MLSFEPFSTDTERFLADGLNIRAGKNPYTAPPPLAIKYAHLRSFYPPLQEAFFAGAAWIYPSPFAFRLLGGLAELSFLLWFFIARRRRLKAARGIYGPWLFLLFNPVSIHEIWREGHLDHIGVFLLYFAILNAHAAFCFARVRTRSWIFAALASAWKFAGILVVPFASARRLWKRIFSLYAITLLAFTALQFSPAILFTPFAENGLLVYKTYWHHGNGIVHALTAFGFATAHAIYLVQWLIFALTAVVAGLYFFRRLALIDATSLALGNLLVLFPVQHPWYYFLLFPFILLSPKWRNLLALVCFLAPLSYLGYVENLKSVGFFSLLIVWVVGCVITFAASPPRRARPLS